MKLLKKKLAPFVLGGAMMLGLAQPVDAGDNYLTTFLGVHHPFDQSSSNILGHIPYFKLGVISPISSYFRGKTDLYFALNNTRYTLEDGNSLKTSVGFLNLDWGAELFLNLGKKFDFHFGSGVSYYVGSVNSELFNPSNKSIDKAKFDFDNFGTYLNVGCNYSINDTVSITTDLTFHLFAPDADSGLSGFSNEVGLVYKVPATLPAPSASQ